MPATYIHFSDEQRNRKESLGVSWEDVMEAGIRALERQHSNKAKGEGGGNDPRK